MSFRRSLFGEISVRGNSNETNIDTKDVWVQVGALNTIGPQEAAFGDVTENHITIPFAETCFISVSSLSICKAVGGGDDTFEFECRKNNGATSFNNLSSLRVIDSGAPGKDIGGNPMHGIVSFDAGDTLELWVRNTTSANNLLIKSVTMSALRLS